MQPAPRPSGIAQRQKLTKLPEYEKDRRATAVKTVLSTVILYVPKVRISLALNTLATTVPQYTIAVTKLPNEKGKPQSS